MSTKIQINSLEALERLIGNDNELELEIRNSVVQNFAEKHLKAVAQSDSITTRLNDINTIIVREVEDKINKEVGSFKTNWAGRVESVKLNSGINDKIDNEVRRHGSKLVTDAIADSNKKWHSEEAFNERIKYYIDSEVEDRIKREVRARLDKIKISL